MKRDTVSGTVDSDKGRDDVLRPDLIFCGHEFVIDRDCKGGLLLRNINNFGQAIFMIISDIEMVLEREDGCTQTWSYGSVADLAAGLRQGGGGTI